MKISDLRYVNSLSRFQQTLRDEIALDRDFSLTLFKLIWDNQTKEEKNCGETIYKNKIGLDGWEGRILSTIGQKIDNGIELTNDEKNKVQKRIPKYLIQLHKIIHKKI